MPSVELSKLSKVSAARTGAAGERTQVETRAQPLSAANPATAPGISLEVARLGVAGSSDTSSPPVDAERVSQIKAALREGSYPLVPTRIVDAMIAAQVSLSLPDRS